VQKCHDGFRRKQFLTHWVVPYRMAAQSTVGSKEEKHKKHKNNKCKGMLLL